MEPTFVIRWLYRHQTGHSVVSDWRNLCAVCGLGTKDTVLLGKVLRPTFTDSAVLRHPRGTIACPACAWYFDNQDLRRSGWYVTESKATAMARRDWYSLLKEHIQRPPEEPGYYLIHPGGMATKHLALYAPMSVGGGWPIPVRFGTVTLPLGLSWLVGLEAAFELRRHHSWKEIKSDSYIIEVAAKKWTGIEEFGRLRQMVQPWLNTAFIDLIEFLWTKERRENDRF